MNNQRSTHEPKRASASATFMLLASLIISPVLLPPQSVAQSNEVPQSNEIDARAIQVQSGVAPKPKAPIGAVSIGYIYGIGPHNGRLILKEAGIDPQRRAKELTEDELAKIIGIIDKGFLVEGALRRQVQQNVSLARGHQILDRAT